MKNKKEDEEKQERLADYCRRRSEFYYQEREKIQERFRQKAKRQGGLTQDDLERAKYLMEINGGDEECWVDEYNEFYRKHQ